MAEHERLVDRAMRACLRPAEEGGITAVVSAVITVYRLRLSTSSGGGDRAKCVPLWLATRAASTSSGCTADTDRRVDGRKVPVLRWLRWNSCGRLAATLPHPLRRRRRAGRHDMGLGVGPARLPLPCRGCKLPTATSIPSKGKKRKRKKNISDC